MSKIDITQDANYLKNEQYKDSCKLGSRAALHKKFGAAPIPWQSWVFDYLGLQPGYAL